MSVVIGAVGDLAVDRSDPAAVFEPVREALNGCDLLFGNCEAVYAPGAWLNPAASGGIGSSPECFAAIVDAGFRVMSVANNHFFDWGLEGLQNTMDLFAQHSVTPVGAGANEDEAWAPKIQAVGDVRIGFVACSAVFPPGAAATARRGGCAGVRVHTVYEGEPGLPGAKPEILTFVDPRDQGRLCRAVADARARSDVVVVSVHWGIPQEAVSVADYESQLGRAAVDAGADAVLGHHQHILKGIELYRGRPIFHGLGNFVCDLRISSKLSPAQLKVRQRKYGPYAVGPREGFDTYPFHPDARKTVLLKLECSATGLVGCELVPCAINPLGQPVPIPSEDENFEEVARYIEEISSEAELDVTLERREGAICVLLDK